MTDHHALIFGLQVVNGTLYEVLSVQELRNGIIIAKLWDMFLGPRLGDLPDKIGWRTGAEFMVARSRVIAHPRKFYLETLAFLLEYNRVKSADPTHHPINDSPSRDLAVAYERLWPLIFGQVSAPQGTST